jgi:predicted nucleotidyltransferase
MTHDAQEPQIPDHAYRVVTSVTQVLGDNIRAVYLFGSAYAEKIIKNYLKYC